jgi:hypothetical protein
MRHRTVALAALLAWPAVCLASDPTGLFVLLFGVPSLLLSLVFAAVALKAPRFGGSLCGLLLISEVPLVFWAGRVGYMDSAGGWLMLSIAILAIGLIVAFVKIVRPPQAAAPKDGNPT